MHAEKFSLQGGLLRALRTRVYLGRSNIAGAMISVELLYQKSVVTRNVTPVSKFVQACGSTGLLCHPTSLQCTAPSFVYQPNLRRGTFSPDLFEPSKTAFHYPRLSKV